MGVPHWCLCADEGSFLPPPPPQFKRKHWQCRPAADEQCDLAEFCTGASSSCPPDLYVQDGHGCEQGTGYCYKGRCQSADLQCQHIYGKGNGCSGITGTNSEVQGGRIQAGCMSTLSPV